MPFNPSELNRNTMTIGQSIGWQTEAWDGQFILNFTTTPNIVDIKGQTPLMWAAKMGDIELVQKLLNAGANVNIEDLWGQTALLLAIQNGHREIVSLLLHQKYPDSMG
ncbi:MAG: ankyrin repeat domain-containing protein [Magnetococcus sp. DMHC-6]